MIRTTSTDEEKRRGSGQVEKRRERREVWRYMSRHTTTALSRMKHRRKVKKSSAEIYANRLA